ncbi:hypothetical protein NE865_11048 [Phthorimaea operculella]|nr:hypothetical protein NE865_11048 [Phthorimaea operculella]
MDVFLTGFPKKLLVAIAVVVILAMLVTPTESRTAHKRHEHTRQMAQTKETHRHPAQAPPVRLRHHRPANLEMPAKKKLNPRAELFKRETRKIFRKLKNTKSFFHYKKEEDLKEYSETAPSWLPTVNFVDIHFHDYRVSRSEAKNGGNKYEKKFRYIMPKLYKSLVEYEELFKTFQKMELNFPDTQTKSYKVKRKELLTSTLNRLYSTIQEVNDSMTAVGITTRPEKLKDFSTLEMKVTNTQCIRIDYLAFRGYTNLLNNWVQQLRCMKKSKQTTIQNLCKKWEEKLKEKLEQRKRRQGRNNDPPQS